ncbi:hypothetical protein K491DRAFT_590728 [Lophiostoma macrostomum CBS 122681]|uniref:Rhodopsin domain-containing protein n=1 Tax=Lophiostoma macrostomum CBS 122681 TaxID=1314788 RepID=A0A6A6TI03_9PLEO|nr:hypothetical protein K491DRAFT_590728 [Lophiostoma macrostomum CBS 122681]
MSDQMEQQSSMVGVTIAMTIIGSLAVALRFYTRSYIVGTLYSDDWVMLAALVWNFGYALEILISAKSFNAGFTMAQLSDRDMMGIVQITAAVVVTYKGVLTLIKVSILCFYLRIAVRPMFEKLCKWTLYLVVVFEFIVIFVTVGECVPLRKMWDFNNTVPGHCIDSGAFFQFASVFHIITDLWVLLLPVPLLRSIPRPPREKYGLFFVFGVGVFAIITAVFRFKFLHDYTVSPDPFYAFAPLMTWSMVEVNVGILCACLPTLRPLFSKSQRDRTRAIKGFSMQNKNDIIEGGAEINSLHSRSSSAASNAMAKEIAVDKTPNVGVSASPPRLSYRPPVPPKTPPPIYNTDTQAVEARIADLERSLLSPGQPTRQLKLVKRDENGMFKPEPSFRGTS